MHRSNDPPDDPFRESAGDDITDPVPPSSNAMPLTALVLALLGIPVVHGLDRVYQLVSGSPTLITSRPALLGIPAIAAVIAIGCMLRKRYRRPQSMMVLAFALFVACFWLGAGLILFSFPSRVVQ